MKRSQTGPAIPAALPFLEITGQGSVRVVFSDSRSLTAFFVTRQNLAEPCIKR